MLDGLSKDLNSFGLADVMDLYNSATEKEEDNKSSSQKTVTNQKYDQIQQGVSSTNNVALPFDNKMFIYGGLGLGALVLIMIVKGK